MVLDSQWTRRGFLVLVAGAAGAVAFRVCTGDDEDGALSATATPTSGAGTPAPGSPTATPTPEVNDYWDLLRETQRRVRTSPDYLPGHLEQFAASGDVDGLIEAVRKHIAILPVNPSAWISQTDGQRWGTRGVLRSRMGTHREIAQLVADTLNAAGLDATVVRTSTPEVPRPGLLNVEPLPFAPDGSPDDLLALAETVLSPEVELADDALAAQVATSALDAFGSDTFNVSSPPALTSTGPWVRVNEDGVERVPDLWTEAGGTLDVDPGRVSDLGAIGAAPNATFTLSIATAEDPTRPIEVAEAVFPLDAMAGRRVDVSFVPPASGLAELMATRPADVTTVIPTIKVDGVDLTPEEESTLFVQGDAFTIEGDTLTEDGDRFLLPGGSIGGSGDPTQVAELKINRIVSAHYPKLSVELEVLDADGGTVTDVPASAFTLTDGDAEVPFTLRRTERPTPRIVFVVDNSQSVPEQYRNAGATRVVTEIATAVKAEHPDAEFRIANVGISGAGLLGWKDDPAVAGDDADQFGIGSALWHSYVDGAAAGPNAMVFLTDGVSITPEGEPEPTAPVELIPALKAAPPAIMLGSSTLGENGLGEAFEGIAEITGGVTLDIDDQGAAIAAVLEQLDRTLTPYDFLVLADEDQPATGRTLTLSLPDADTDVSAPFEVPAADAVIPGPSLVGIYLRVNANGRIVDRTLAGLPYRTADEVTPELIQEVRQALFGAYSVITEAGTPSPSQILDDAITEALSWETVFTSEDADEVMSAFSAAHRLPHGAFAFSVPVDGEGALTWESGLRMWLSTERTAPRGDVDVLRRSLDLLPTNLFHTATDDPAESVRLTAERTSRLAAIEAALTDTNATERLTGPLTAPGFGDMTAEQRLVHDRLTNGWPGTARFAVNEAFDAAMATDPTTGTMIAVLPDGTGGGTTEEEIKARFKQAIAMTELAGGAGGAFKHWAALEKAKLEKLQFATLVIFRMSVEGILETIREEACKKLSKEATGWALSGMKRLSGTLHGMTALAQERLKEINRWGDAAGLPPGLPTKLKVC